MLPLSIHDLYFRSGDKTLLHGINLHIDTPGITVVMGPNGAGKSLLVRLIHGLVMPSAGSISWAGAAIDLSTRKRQAMVFQKPVLLRRSVAANIDFVLSGPGKRDLREQILRQAGLIEQSSQAARSLSGGEQQRLALARALATDPDVLILDEPCANLDPASTQRIEQLLRQSRDRQVKIFLVTHDIGQAKRLADDLVFMHAGRVDEHTTAESFFESPSSTYARAYLDGRLVF